MLIGCVKLLKNRFEGGLDCVGFEEMVVKLESLGWRDIKEGVRKGRVEHFCRLVKTVAPQTNIFVDANLTAWQLGSREGVQKTLARPKCL